MALCTSKANAALTFLREVKANQPFHTVHNDEYNHLYKESLMIVKEP